MCTDMTGLHVRNVRHVNRIQCWTSHCWKDTTLNQHTDCWGIYYEHNRTQNLPTVSLQQLKTIWSERRRLNLRGSICCTLLKAPQHGQHAAQNVQNAWQTAESHSSAADRNNTVFQILIADFPSASWSTSCPAPATGSQASASEQCSNPAEVHDLLWWTCSNTAVSHYWVWPPGVTWSPLQVSTGTLLQCTRWFHTPAEEPAQHNHHTLSAATTNQTASTVIKNT